MPPKAAKKGSAKKPSAAGAAVNKNWEAGLTGAQFEEVCYLTELFLYFFFSCVFKTFLFSAYKVKLREFSGRVLISWLVAAHSTLSVLLATVFKMLCACLLHHFR